METQDFEATPELEALLNDPARVIMFYSTKLYTTM